MRREVFITMDAADRDQGKVFHLREMPATQAEAWAMRALLALDGADLEADPRDGMAGLVRVGLQALLRLPWDAVQPLRDELLRCVSYCPRPERTSIRIPLGPENADAYVEEPATLIRLRGEALRLHTDFFPDGGPASPAPDRPCPAP